MSGYNPLHNNNLLFLILYFFDVKDSRFSKNSQGFLYEA